MTDKHKDFEKGLALMREIADIDRQRAQANARLIAKGRGNVITMWQCYVEAWRYEEQIQTILKKMKE